MKKILNLIVLIVIGVVAYGQNVVSTDTLYAKKVDINGNEVPSIPMTEAERVESLEEDMALSFYSTKAKWAANAFESKVVSHTLFTDFSNLATVALGTTSGLRMVGMPVNIGDTIKSVGFTVSTAGSGFSNFNGVGVFTKSGTTFTQVAVSANSSTPFESIGMKEVALISEYICTGKVVYVGALTSATSGASIYAVDVDYDWFKIGDIHYYDTGNTTMPTTIINPNTSTSSDPIFILY